MRYTEIDTEEFVDIFPNTRNDILADRYGVSEFTVIRWARSNGIRKTKEHRSNVSRETYNPVNVARGDKHYNWKGGRSWKRFADPEYVKWRSAVLTRDKYTCQICGEVHTKSSRSLHAHHIIEYAKDEKRRLDVSNGQTLCKWCHMKVHNKERIREKILCACGCGTELDKYDRSGRERRYINYHGKKGKTKQRIQ